MRETSTFALLIPACLLLGISTSAKADIITSTVPEYSGPFYDFSTTYPLSSVTIGTFTYSIPAGESILRATVSGTFGNSEVANSTALSNYFVSGINVASCSSFSDVCFNPNSPSDAPETWSYTFTPAQLSRLTAGSADFSVVETGPFTVQTGPTTLTVTTTPEPALSILIGAGLLSLGLFRRARKERSNKERSK